MKELTAREVQLGELSVAKQFDAICKRLNLRYWLMYGTLLGAVRHQGFIPWDDDVDVMMPRPDYEKLIDYLIAHENEFAPLKLMHYRSNPNYIYPIARLCDTRYSIRYNRAKDYGLGLFVDIYPVDGCGNTLEEATKLINSLKFDMTKISLAGLDKYYASTGNWLRNIPKYLVYLYAKLRGAQYFARKLDEKGKVYDYEESKYVALTIWEPEVVAFEKDWFRETIYVQYEDTQFAIPVDYDKVLTQYFGDYMTLPPEEQRIAHHDYIAYLKDDVR